MAGKIIFHYGPNFSLLTRKYLSDHPHTLSTDGSSLYITGNMHRSALLKERYLLSAPAAVAADIPFVHENRFMQLIYEKLNLTGSPFSREERLLILHNAIQRISRDLSYFHYGDRSFPLSVLNSLLSFFDDIRSNGDETLLAQPAQFNLGFREEDNIHSDLHRVFGLYLEMLGADGWDEAERLHRYSMNISADFMARYFSNLAIMTWEDISHFNNSHLSLIQQLKKVGLEIHLLLPYGYNEEIFSFKKPLFEKIKKISDATADYPDTTGISDSLFKIDPAEITYPGQVTISGEVDKLREVQHTAAAIKRLVVDNGWRFADIHVSSPALFAYRSMLEAVFSGYGIPFSFTNPEPLSGSLVVQHLLLPVRLVEENYSLNTLQAILHSPFLNYKRGLGGSEYKAILGGLRIRTGREEILQQLYEAREIYTRADKAFGAGSGNAEVYLTLENTLSGVFQDCVFFEKPHTASEIVAYYSSFLKKHDFASNILADMTVATEKPAEDNLAALRVFVETLTDWGNLMKRQAVDPLFSAAEIARNLNILISVSTYQPRRLKNFGVQITSPGQVPYSFAAAVFILGMEEGQFPAGRSPRFAQQESLPATLKPYLRDDSGQRDRELFLKILQMPLSFLRFSYSRFQQDNPRLPSVFLRELSRLSDKSLRSDPEISLVKPTDLLTELSLNGPADIAPQTLTRHLNTVFQAEFDNSKIELFTFRKGIINKRENNKQTSAWEGMLSGEPAAFTWIKDYFENTSFSVSQLEDFATCPIIFFFKRILHIEPEAEAEEFSTPLDRGITLHAILFRFYSKLSPKEQTLDRLMAIAEEEFEKVPVHKGILWALEKDFYFNREDKSGLLPAFWEKEKEYSRNYLTVPRHFEYAFGMRLRPGEMRDPASRELPFSVQMNGETFLFKGKIDRVEISPAGELLVVDYKTGSYPDLFRIWKGESLQLPIYLKAVRDLLAPAYPELKMAGGAYYSLKSNKELTKKISFLDGNAAVFREPENRLPLFPGSRYQVDNRPATLDDLIRRTFDFAIQYIRNIRQGEYPHTRELANCRKWDGTNCDFLPLCRLNREKQAFLNKRAGMEDDSAGKE